MGGHFFGWGAVVRTQVFIGILFQRYVTNALGIGLRPPGEDTGWDGLFGGIQLLRRTSPPSPHFKCRHYIGNFDKNIVPTEILKVSSIPYRPTLK